MRLPQPVQNTAKSEHASSHRVKQIKHRHKHFMCLSDLAFQNS